MKTLSQVIEKIESSKDSIEFLPTGFRELDNHLDGGFMRKELIVVGAYTGVGKSYLAGQIFSNIAQKGFRSAYFSLEISAEMVVARLWGANSRIKPTRIIAGLLTPEEFEYKQQAKADLLAYEPFVYFYDDTYVLMKIRDEIKRGGYEFVVVDFVQNVIVGTSDEYERLSLVALEFQKLAKETNSCILLLSQLSNAAARNNLTEYKGSGSIATVCDIGMFLKRSNPEGDMNKLELEIKKNRRGFSGYKISLTFQQPGGWIE